MDIFVQYSGCNEILFIEICLQGQMAASGSKAVKMRQSKACINVTSRDIFGSETLYTDIKISRVFEPVPLEVKFYGVRIRTDRTDGAFCLCMKIISNLRRSITAGL